MSIRKLATARSPYRYAIGAALTFGLAFQAHAQQTNIDNIQSAVQPYISSIFTGAGIFITNLGSVSAGDTLWAKNAGPGDKLADILRKLKPGIIGACLDDPSFAVVLFFYKNNNKADPSEAPESYYLSTFYKGNLKLQSRDPEVLVKYIDEHRDIAQKVMSGFFSLERDKGAKEIKFALNAIGFFYDKERARAITLPINFCKPSPTIKASAPFNPSDETNVLKSSQNNSPGTSWGYGGTLQAFVPVTLERNQKDSFDVIGVSAQSQSVQYAQYPTKSSNSVTTQAAYQLFLDASGYQSDGLGTLNRIDRITPSNTFPGEIPPTGMITVDSIAFGFQNQTIYTAGFAQESVNLFTPQITFNRQNQDLPLFGASQNICKAAIPDPRKDGFCLYADFSLTLGETLSDVATQKNANVALSATPGVRIQSTDWKLTLPMTATERDYQDVIGGRRDTLLQIGPALTYSPPPFNDRYGGNYAVTFALPMTYNQNYSTVQADSWHGVIILPSLTVAFTPPAPGKADQ
jgi:hypothetical protein